MFSCVNVSGCRWVGWVYVVFFVVDCLLCVFCFSLFFCLFVMCWVFFNLVCFFVCFGVCSGFCVVDFGFVFFCGIVNKVIEKIWYIYLA